MSMERESKAASLNSALLPPFSPSPSNHPGLSSFSPQLEQHLSLQMEFTNTVTNSIFQWHEWEIPAVKLFFLHYNQLSQGHRNLEWEEWSDFYPVETVHRTVVGMDFQTLGIVTVESHLVFKWVFSPCVSLRWPKPWQWNPAGLTVHLSHPIV